MKNNILTYLIFSIGFIVATPQHQDRIVDIIISSDKSTHVTASKDGKIIIWDHSNQEVINSFNIDPTCASIIFTGFL